MSFWQQLIGPLIGAAGNLGAGAMSAKAQDGANKANIALNKENRTWAENMSNTEFQRGIADMKAAGINPMLAISQGGASTPNNSAATVQPVDGLARGLSSASDKAAQTIAYQQAAANIELTRATTLKTLADADTAQTTAANAPARQEAELANVRAQYRAILEGEDLTKTQRSQIEELLPGMIEQQRQQLELTKANVTSAKAEGRLKEADIPSAEAAAKMWSGLAEGKVDQGVMLKLILAIRSVLR